MNRSDRGIIVGMVLGDGCIRVRERVKLPEGYKWRTQELRVKHSHKQTAYAEHKAAIVARMFGGKCNVRPTQVTTLGKIFDQVMFTKSHKYFRTLHRVMYPGGKKTITRQVLDYLTPEGIAIWYMDDGNCAVNRNKDGWVSSCATIISTCCSEEETKNIQSWFASKHDIKIKIFHAKNDKYSIRMNTGESQKFARLIEPYIIPEMRYKLAHVANLNVQECRPTAMQCRECGDAIYEIRRRMLCVACYSRQLKR